MSYSQLSLKEEKTKMLTCNWDKTHKWCKISWLEDITCKSIKVYETLMCITMVLLEHVYIRL